MAFKPALCRASQSSSFGHFSPPPQTSITTTLNCILQHNPHPARATHSTIQESCQNIPSYDALNHDMKRFTAGLNRGTADRALDKALDIWYTTGVGLKETHKQEQ